VETVRNLADLAGVSFPERERTEAEVRKAEELDRREALLKTFLARAQAALQEEEGKTARDYLTGRGLGDALDFLGFYSTRKKVLKALVSTGFTEEEVKASGVVYDQRWEGRLIIPWRDRWGRLGTIAARALRAPWSSWRASWTWSTFRPTDSPRWPPSEGAEGK